jgi:hypothetical protein
MYCLPILLIILHLISPALAAAILWGLLPGLAIGLLLLGIQYGRRRAMTRRPAVFQSVAASTAIPAPPSVASSRSVLIADAATLVPEPRSAVR